MFNAILPCSNFQGQTIKSVVLWREEYCSGALSTSLPATCSKIRCYVPRALKGSRPRFESEAKVHLIITVNTRFYFEDILQISGTYLNKSLKNLQIVPLYFVQIACE